MLEGDSYFAMSESAQQSAPRGPEASSLPASPWGHDEFEPPLLFPERGAEPGADISPEVRRAGLTHSARFAALLGGALLYCALATASSGAPWLPASEAVGVWAAAGVSLTVGAALLWAPFTLTARGVVASSYWIALSLALSWWQVQEGVLAGLLASTPWRALLVVATVALVPSSWTWATVLMVAVAASRSVVALSGSGSAPVLGDVGAFLYGIEWLAVACAQLLYVGVSAAWRRLGREQLLAGYPLRRRIGGSKVVDVWLITSGRLALPVLAHVLRVPSDARTRVFESFRRDMALRARLQSPHLPVIVDFGRTRTRELYVVSERCSGLTLQELNARHGDSYPERVIFILSQICHALHEAHQKGLIHGALNPASVLVGARGLDFDHVRVLGLGMGSWHRMAGVLSAARPADAADVGGFSVQQEYLAPEQVMGAGELTPAVDVYALRCLGYWMLASRPPFTAESKRELTRLQLESPAPRLSEVCKLNPPKDIEQVLLDCLAKDPEERIADVNQLRVRLRRCLAANHWSSGRAQRWWEANEKQSDQSDASSFGPRLPRRDMLAGLLGRADE